MLFPCMKWFEWGYSTERRPLVGSSNLRGRWVCDAKFDVANYQIVKRVSSTMLQPTLLMDVAATQESRGPARLVEPGLALFYWLQVEWDCCGTQSRSPV